MGNLPNSYPHPCTSCNILRCKPGVDWYRTGVRCPDPSWHTHTVFADGHTTFAEAHAYLREQGGWLAKRLEPERSYDAYREEWHFMPASKPFRMMLVASHKDPQAHTHLYYWKEVETDE